MNVFALVLLFCAQEDRPLRAVMKAIEKTAGGAYYYSVSGRFQRTGVVRPKDILTSRIRHYRAARKGNEILVLGPEGLWKAPGEGVREKVEGLGPEVREIIQTLEEAEPPHALVTRLLPHLRDGRRDGTVEVEGVPCRRYAFSFKPASLRRSMEGQLEKGIKRGERERPVRVRWPTIRGSLRFYIHEKDGFLVRVLDEQSVKVVYRARGVEDTRGYRNEMDYRFSGYGLAKLNLPKEVKARLKIGE